MSMIRVTSWRARLLITVCAASSAFGVPSSATPTAGAAGISTVIAGPKYSRSNTLNTMRQLDCSVSNPYFANSACSLTIDTNTAGCIWEKQSTDSAATLPGASPCRVAITGPVPFRALPAYCFLGSTESTLRVVYTVGNQPGRSASPFEFYASATLAPTAFNGNATATRRYSMKVTAVNAPATATGQNVPIGFGTISEVFTVDFAYPVKDHCPNRDGGQYSIGNVKDARSDNVQQDNAPAGFIKVQTVSI